MAKKSQIRATGTLSVGFLPSILEGMRSLAGRAIRWVLRVVAPISPIWWGILILTTASDREAAVYAFLWVGTIVLSLLELTGVLEGPEIFRAFPGGRPRFWLSIYLASNGVGLLLLSASADSLWWESLWLDLGGALLLGAVIDLLLEVRLGQKE